MAYKHVYGGSNLLDYISIDVARDKKNILLPTLNSSFGYDNYEIMFNDTGYFRVKVRDTESNAAQLTYLRLTGIL